MTHLKFLIGLAGVIALAAIINTNTGDAVSHEEHEKGPGAEALLTHSAVAVLTPTSGHEVRGTVRFQQSETGVSIKAELKGLTPGKHGIHIHEFGDISAPDGSSVGEHFNPLNANHGGPESPQHHLGDLGNIEADEDGNATWESVDPQLALNGPLSVIGRAIVVHSGEDDFETQPSGDSGDRVAVGVIGAAKSSAP